MSLAALARVLLVAALALASGCASTAVPVPGPGSFSFGAFGDMPYFRHEQAWTEDILREMDALPLAFVVHNGDIKRGSTPCSEEVYQWNLRLFQSSAHPLIYVPGDNEWSDCHRTGADPLERLARLRAIFHAGDESLGKRRIRLDRQSASPTFAAYRENVRWAHGGVLFVTLNMPGGNNNLGFSRPGDAEFRVRDAANEAWLAQAFEVANRRLHRAVVIVIQANPLFELPRTEKQRRGYTRFLDQLEAETIAFGKPVLLIHGDTHFHRIDQPMIDRRTRRPVTTFTRLETYGSPFLGWVQVTVDPGRPEVFLFDPHRHAPRTQSEER